MPNLKFCSTAHAVRLSSRGGEFSKKHKVTMGLPGDDAKNLLTDKGALDWFKSMSFPVLPYVRNAQAYDLAD